MEKVCRQCRATFAAEVPQRLICDVCRDANTRARKLRAQKRYERSDKGKQTKHKYQGAEGKKQRLTPSQEQVMASNAARFARD